MNRFLKLILILLIPLLSFGQEKDFYDLDNSYHKLFKKSKIKSLKVLTKEYNENGDLNAEYIELIQNFDKNGDIIWEKEFYDDSTAAWEVNYNYNDNHQTIRTEWTWLDDNEKELTEYYYDSIGKLTKSCDFIKNTNSSNFNLENCDIYFYKNNLIEKVISKDNIVLCYFKIENGIISKYSSENKLSSKYQNGELIFRKQDSTSYHYERNSIGQLTKITEIDKFGQILNTTNYEYKNGLTKKIISEGNFGNLLHVEVYTYEYYD